MTPQLSSTMDQSLDADNQDHGSAGVIAVDLANLATASTLEGPVAAVEAGGELAGLIFQGIGAVLGAVFSA